jgi:hypothetical protein
MTAYDRYENVPVVVHRPKPTQPRRPVGTAKAVPPDGGATARCNDGTYFYAAHHHQGACSHHHGVAVFYK